MNYSPGEVKTTVLSNNFSNLSSSAAILSRVTIFVGFFANILKTSLLPCQRKLQYTIVDQGESYPWRLLEKSWWNLQKETNNIKKLFADVIVVPSGCPLVILIWFNTSKVFIMMIWRMSKECTSMCFTHVKKTSARVMHSQNTQIICYPHFKTFLSLWSFKVQGVLSKSSIWFYVSLHFFKCWWNVSECA